MNLVGLPDFQIQGHPGPGNIRFTSAQVLGGWRRGAWPRRPPTSWCSAPSLRSRPVGGGGASTGPGRRGRAAPPCGASSPFKGAMGCDDPWQDVFAFRVPRSIPATGYLPPPRCCEPCSAKQLPKGKGGIVPRADDSRVYWPIFLMELEIADYRVQKPAEGAGTGKQADGGQRLGGRGPTASCGGGGLS